jgi:sulfite exporter TauE/SafE
MRLVRNPARSHAALAPALLGVATVLLPCGVTLSVEALALATGSPWRGAAIMAVFVVGTSPLFAILGYAARKAATVWRGRLVAATDRMCRLRGCGAAHGKVMRVSASWPTPRILYALVYARVLREKDYPHSESVTSVRRSR